MVKRSCARWRSTGPRFWADETGQSDDRFVLADQPVSFMDFDEDDEISAREFESAWKKAREATGYPV